MKPVQNLHTHSIYCDGKNTPKELIEKAISLGFKSIGFSGHGYTPFILTYCMDEIKTSEYIAEINKLKQEYKGKIQVFLGIEYDLYSKGSLAPYDYVIGSVHYLKDINGNFFSVDIKSSQSLISVINEKFNGNAMALCKAYYETISNLKRYLDRVDIVGHFDLITKSNDEYRIIDTECEEYREYATKAIKKLVKDVGVFEINTGAVARGIKKEPYPDKWLLTEIFKQGGKIVITSDCHDKEYLNFYFDKAVQLAKECGFTEIYYFKGKGFEPFAI